MEGSLRRSHQPVPSVETCVRVPRRRIQVRAINLDFQFQYLAVIYR